MQISKISYRTTRILNLFLLGLLLILARVWYLSTVQREDRLKEAHKPQRRTVIERVNRATIRDRFNLPLAMNQLQYNASICYAQIRQIPSISWKKDSNGKSIKTYQRREYITNLAELLGKELRMNPLEIEDIIYGKASLFPHTPFVIKEDLSEESYYRLKMLERQWLGIHMERASKRFYPQGKIASHVVGYVSSINQREYWKIANEIKELEQYIKEREEGNVVFLPKGYLTPLEVRERLTQLHEKAYTIHDFIGKSGIEEKFDEKLRGSYGKKTYEIDTKGNFLRELPGSRLPTAGQRVILTLSSELQETAEQLLAEHEKFQDERDASKSKARRHPWQRGGAIVALIPQTGEVVALASYPRFDPNDFVKARQKNNIVTQNINPVAEWLENDQRIADIWDGRASLKRELFSHKSGHFFEDHLPLTWEMYLDLILTKDSEVRKALDRVPNLASAISFQKLLKDLFLRSQFDSLKEFVKCFDQVRLVENHPLQLLNTITHEQDKFLFLDLLKICAQPEDFSDSLLAHIGAISLSDLRMLAQTVHKHFTALHRQIQEIFHDVDFFSWRQCHFKEYLQKKRQEERAKKLYARPYTEYLDIVEKKLFSDFWNDHRYLFLRTLISGELSKQSDARLQGYLVSILDLRKRIVDAHSNFESFKEIFQQSYALDLLQALRPYHELNRPLIGTYPLLRNSKGKQLEKHLAAAFYPSNGFGYGRSYAYRQATPLGSIFKLIPAYHALMLRHAAFKQQLRDLQSLNPLTLIDESPQYLTKDYRNQILGYFNDQPIRRIYDGGRMPRSSHAGIGRVDLGGAIEQSSNLYFSILANQLENPESLAATASSFGLGSLTGIELPGEYGGKVPDDLAQNKTGLYSFAIGQHSLVVTPLQVSLMIASIANKGTLVYPHMIKVIAGKETSFHEENLFSKTDYPLKEDLSLLGIQFPFFPETLTDLTLPYVSFPSHEIRRTLPFPAEVHQFLLESMHRVMTGSRGTARPSAINPAFQNPNAIKDFLKLYPQLAGKTGTAEILYKQTIEKEFLAQMEKHVSFGGIAFTDASLTNPDLVVVVFLRFGDSGKDAAPLAARIVQRWREISEKHAQTQ